MRTALTIAGSDPGGGAGIQADLKVFAAHGVYGTSAITALTVQSSTGVRQVHAVDASLVGAQIDAIVPDFGADATKIGMLANADIVTAVAKAIGRHSLTRVVLDPVILATSGATLLDDRGVAALVRLLLPLAAVVTPNATEAARLTDQPVVATLEDAQRAARALVGRGASAAIVTGGHLDGPPIDVVFDGHEMVELPAERIEGAHTHGTGCAFSSALAARLALGDDLLTAARAAKTYVTRAIAQRLSLGQGRKPLQHFPRLGSHLDS